MIPLVWKSKNFGPISSRRLSMATEEMPGLFFWKSEVSLAEKSMLCRRCECARWTLPK